MAPRGPAGPPAKSKNSGRRVGGGADNAIWKLPAVRPDHIWTFDFMGDHTADGAPPVRVLNTVDEYTCRCVAVMGRAVSAPAGSARSWNGPSRPTAAGDHPV